jgi:hypothetical protein
MLLAVYPEAQVPDGGAQFPVQVPVLAVLGPVKVKEVLQHLGGADQFGIEFFGKYVIRGMPVGNVDAAFQVVGREDSDFFGVGDFTEGIVHNGAPAWGKDRRSGLRGRSRAALKR